MIKIYVVFLFLLSFHLTNTAKIEVEYDEIRDIILFKNVLYFPSQLDTIGRLQIKNEIVIPGNTNTAHVGGHEEELAQGATFWAYVFFILCKQEN
jgi:hypothetical protein